MFGAFRQQERFSSKSFIFGQILHRSLQCNLLIVIKVVCEEMKQIYLMFILQGKVLTTEYMARTVLGLGFV